MASSLRWRFRQGKQTVSLVVAWLALAQLPSACGPGGDTTGVGAGSSSAASLKMHRPAAHEGGRSTTWAVLINGGGTPARNYRSHLVHVRRMHRLLIDGGVAPDNILVFASDGEGPDADLAVLDRTDDDWWLLGRSPVARTFAPRTELVDSTFDGVPLLPATRNELAVGFSRLTERMRPDDTLLVYVTDHGWRDPVDLRNNAIVLWNERLVVDDLVRMLAPIRRRSRVVMLMSQCFSGAFARAMRPVSGAEPDGRVCGYFASTANRFAYGCYAENRGRDNVGYSFRLLESWRRAGDLSLAHGRVLLEDRTPDVPHKTSDAYLLSLLELSARAENIEVDAYADRMIEQAWADELHYEDLFTQIDALGEAYGAFGPRSLRELGERLENLPALSRDLRASAREWEQLAAELVAENLADFLATHPEWAAVADVETLGDLSEQERGDTLDALVRSLRGFAQANAERWRDLTAYRRMEREARNAAYRMQVRLGAALRLRDLLMRIAGLVYLDRLATDDQRAAFEALEACEGYKLPAQPPYPRGGYGGPAPYPPLADEMELLAAVLPGWLGLEYRPLDARARGELGLAGGAALVTRVHPHSPAADAGIVAGDVILGPPGNPFERRAGLREWVLTSMVDDVRELELIRAGRRELVAIRMGAAPG